MPALNDYDFGKAYQAEILHKAEIARLAKQTNSTKAEHSGIQNMKDRFLLAAGNILISFGWKVRRASSYTYPCPEPKRV